MRISQLRVAKDIGFFGEHLSAKHDLLPYEDRYAPAIFYGCYSREDVQALAEHKSFAVLLWGGSDAMSLRTIDAVRNLARSAAEPIMHIAPSSFIAEDLQRAGIWDYRRINIFPVSESRFTPTPLGRKVYAYCSMARPEFYGFPEIQLLKKALPDVEFIVGGLKPPVVPHSQIDKVYAECAVGLRLVPHDAGSCMVVEMGLMGRKVVWNGCFPNAIGYRSLDDVARAVRQELSRAGEIDYALANEVRAALADDCWLDTEWYRKDDSDLLRW